MGDAVTEATSTRGLDGRWHVLVFLTAVVAHLPSLGNGWTLDDQLLLVDNPYLRSLSGLLEMLHNELFATSAAPRIVPYYRPVTALLYWLSYQILGTNTVLQHLLNVLLHAACCVLFARAACALGARRAVAVAAGLVLAVHPATSDVVAYIGGRQDLLGWTIVWLGVTGVIRARRWWAPAAWSFTVVLAGALTREFFGAAMVLLVIAVAFRAPVSRKHGIAGVLIAGATALGVLAALRRLFDIAPFVTEGVRVVDAPGAAAAVALRLLRNVLWPTDLAVDVTIVPLSLAAALIVTTLLGALAFSLVWGTRRRVASATPATVLGSAAFFLLVVMHTGVALKYGFISDRYSYGAVAAIMLAVAPVLSTLRPPTSFRLLSNRRLLASLGGASLIGLALLAWARDADYRNNGTLQQALMRERPDDPQALFARAAWLMARGREQEAFPLCVRYQQHMPRSNSANLCIGIGLLRRGKTQEAADALWPYALSRPGEVRPRVLLFRALFALNDLDRVEEALTYFEPSFGQSPDIQAARRELERRRAGGDVIPPPGGIVPVGPPRR